jgi:hypothetical protein
MRQFYLEYSDIQIMEQLVPELKQLLQKGGKTTKNKISFLEQPVPEIPDFVGSQKKRKWALKVLKQLVAGIPWGHKLVGMASGYLFDIPNYLLKGVREGADYNRNQVITLSELQLYLETLVPKDAKQTPQRITLEGSRGGQFVFYWEGEE